MEIESESSRKTDFESQQTCSSEPSNKVIVPPTNITGNSGNEGRLGTQAQGLSNSASCSKKRKKTPQEKLEEQQKRRERELKKLSDCWSLNNKPATGPRTRRSSLGACTRVQSDFINYENDRHFFDGLISIPLSRKSGSASAGGSAENTRKISRKNIEDTELNHAKSPVCKKELSFLSKDISLTPDIKNMSMLFNKDVLTTSDIKNIPLLEDDVIKLDRTVENKANCDMFSPCMKFTKLKSTIDKVKVNLESDKLTINHSTCDEKSDYRDDFFPVRRKKLRSEISDQELWEGFPVDLKLPRLKNKVCKKQSSSMSNTINNFEICTSSNETTTTYSQDVVEGQKLEASTCGSTDMETQLKNKTPTKNSRGASVLTRLKAKTPEKYGLNSVQNSDIFKSLPEPAPRKRKIPSIELLDDMRLAKSASTLWVSEGRRRFQQEHPNATSQQLDQIMKKAWEKLAVKQKLVYFIRAKAALEDTNRASQAKKQARRKEKPLGNLSTEIFLSLSDYEKDVILKQRLSKLESEMSREQYTAFLRSFYQSYSEEKHSSRVMDRDNNLARKLLYRWIVEAESSLMEMKLERASHYRNKLQQRYNSLVEDIIHSYSVNSDEKNLNIMIVEETPSAGNVHSRICSENLCDAIEAISKNKRVTEKSEATASRNCIAELKKELSFNKILEGLEHGSVTGLLKVVVNGDTWNVPNVVNRDNYKKLLLSTVTDNLPVLDANRLEDYLKCLTEESEDTTTATVNDWILDTQKNEIIVNSALYDRVAESPVTFLNELSCMEVDQKQDS